MLIVLKGNLLMNGIGLSKTRREAHLRNVAELAKKFGDEFGSGEWGYLAELWHDIKSKQLSKGG